MAARKLQTEIDRTLKKVSEGVEQFEEQYQKILQTTNPAHKEKIESELKTQIKKLQRLRDQIKTWLASNDIKDKKALVDNRKLIETQMERFKACEKEMKTKAFSKEGLSAGTRIDPKEQAKLETVGFIQNQVDELSRQVESTEAEVEQLQGGAKKSKKGAASNAERIDLLETQNERRNWHISRLELINRLIDNGNLDADRVQSLKEDISYFVESNTEEDFEEDEGIYDELNLDDEEEAFGMANDDLQSSHDSMSLADTSDIAPPPPTIRTPAKKETKPAAKDEADNDKSPTTAKSKSNVPAPARKPTLDGTAQRPTGLTGPGSRTSSGTVGVSASKDTAPSAPAPRAVPTVLPPIRYSAAAASAVHAQASPQAASTTPAATAAPPVASPTSVVSPPTTQPLAIPKAANASPEIQKAALPTPTASVGMSSEASPSPAPSQASGPTSSTVPQTSVSSGSPKASAAPDAARVLSPSQQAASIAPLQALEVNSQAQQQRAPSQSAEDKTGIPMSDEATQPLASPNSQAPTLPQAGIIGQGSGTSAEPRLPSSLADLVTSFESAKQKSLRRDNDLGAIHNILEAGYPNIPQPADAEKPKYYIPRNPYPTPSYYPQQPSPHLANPSLFAKFDVDTLFYIFYYCQGTYVQYLAAQELKKQSWRFHKQYLTWFQRANEPQTITDEYEQGVYLYFDFEGSWAQRRKENFSFFYRHLEE